eukprot:6265471-Amphidinium_carterae.4
MQANFDRLFSAFEARNTEAPHKAPRTDDLRGGAPLLQETDYADLILDDALFNLAFCNPSTFRVHVDRILDDAFDAVLLAESNHCASDIKEVRILPQTDGRFVCYNLAWTHPVRTVGDHHLKGRPSAGLVLAAKKPILRHPLASPDIENLDREGRLLFRRIEIFANCWVNVFGIYAPVVGWDQDTTASTNFLAALMEQAMQARGALLDIGQVLAVDGVTQAPTYRTSSAASVIDRVMCTPALIRYVAGLAVCTSAGTGAHQPIVVSFHSDAPKSPLQLVEVLQIPPPQDACDPKRVLFWQLCNADNFRRVREALDEGDVNGAYFRWATIWEQYLQRIAPQAPNCNGRSTQAGPRRKSSSEFLLGTDAIPSCSPRRNAPFGACWAYYRASGREGTQSPRRSKA